MPDLSHAIQDYLKAIYELEREHGRATTNAIARRMGVSAPSATAMLKKLASLGLVRHERYKGAQLTEKGELAAVEVIRHHRLLELYLSETLGLPLDELHAEADRLEHVLSEELEARIDASLGYPTHDPHGDPIPSAALEIDDLELRDLSSVQPGEQVTIRRIPDRDPKLLRYLATLALVPGSVVTIKSVGPRGGPVVLSVGTQDHSIAREVADAIGV